MSQRFRIAGNDSELAKTYPDVARLLTLSGKNMSNICYGCMDLFIRCLGFCPNNKEEVKEMALMLKTLNEHGVIPWLIVSNDEMHSITNNSISNGIQSLNGSECKWNNPDMEEELF